MPKKVLLKFNAKNLTLYVQCCMESNYNSSYIGNFGIKRGCSNRHHFFGNKYRYQKVNLIFANFSRDLFLHNNHKHRVAVQTHICHCPPFFSHNFCSNIFFVQIFFFCSDILLPQYHIPNRKAS